VAAVYRVSWSADSRMLVSASKDSTLKVCYAIIVRAQLIELSLSTCQIWNLKTYKLRVDLPGHTDEVYCVDFVADKIASGGKDKTLKMYAAFDYRSCLGNHR
jgi:ribosome assembly protein 4